MNIFQVNIFFLVIMGTKIDVRLYHFLKVFNKFIHSIFSNVQLFTLGLDSQFGTVQGVIQAAVDLKLFPDSLRKEFQTGEEKTD